MTKLARRSIAKTSSCWRYTPRRLEAEPIRDTLLAVIRAARLVDVRPGHA